MQNRKHADTLHIVRVLGACSLGGSGHWQPLRSLLHAAVQCGDEVRVIAPPAMREMIESDGFTYVEGGEPLEELIAPVREVLGDERFREQSQRVAAEMRATPTAAEVLERFRDPAQL